MSYDDTNLYKVKHEQIMYTEKVPTYIFPVQPCP